MALRPVAVDILGAGESEGQLKSNPHYRQTGRWSTGIYQQQQVYYCQAHWYTLLTYLFDKGFCSCLLFLTEKCIGIANTA